MIIGMKKHVCESPEGNKSFTLNTVNMTRSFEMTRKQRRLDLADRLSFFHFPLKINSEKNLAKEFAFFKAA